MNIKKILVISTMLILSSLDKTECRGGFHGGGYGRGFHGGGYGRG